MKLETKQPRNMKRSSFSSRIQNISAQNHHNVGSKAPQTLPFVMMLTTFPPRECGIATYSKDLVTSLSNVFGDSFEVKICALYDKKHPIPASEHPDYRLNTDALDSYNELAATINDNPSIELVMIQHEFGLYNGCSDMFIDFLKLIKKPIVVGFHTVIPNPDQSFLTHVQKIVECAVYITVMTESSKLILTESYKINPSKIEVINHGTHLIKHKNKPKLKLKYGLEGKKVVSTFGLLGPGKNIETTLDALPGIVADFPDVLFLILGKTHPTLVHHEGEVYRDFLTQKVTDLKLESNVKFVNQFLPLDTLLDYLQLTDIYVFSSKDPNQAVSGTFAYAMSCGCPIVSTPIPHAKEFLSENKGLLFDFGDSKMLTKQLKVLLNDKTYRKNLGLNGLHASSATSWENSALLHGKLFKKLSKNITLKYGKPDIKLDHLFKMTTDVGLIQFAKLNQPDITTGYTLDDNARALIVVCETYKLTRDEALLKPLTTYFNFILNCQRVDGTFLNYVDQNEQFTTQNENVNLEDSNGRAIWAIGQMLSIQEIVPESYDYFFDKAHACFDDFLATVSTFNSPRAMAFIIKGMTISGLVVPESLNYFTFLKLGSKLSKMYEHESVENWNWFETYLTYGNSILPEAMLDVYKLTNIEKYKVIAFTSFNFLLKHLFIDDKFNVISNQTWFLKGDSIKGGALGGQQPIDVAYTILALKNFDQLFPLEGYREKMELAFSWFMGNNHLNQIVYNPCTTGCFDGLELKNVNLNQGAESTVSYLLARLAFEDLPQSH